MKNLSLFLVFGLIALFLASCNESGGEAKEEKKLDDNKAIGSKIMFLEKEIMEKFDDKKVGELIKLCLDYEKKFPKDSMVPFFLYKAASNYSYLNQPYEALKCFDRVYKLFPNYEKAPVCLFHIAGIYSDQLNDTAKARELYNIFIDKYPDHKLVLDARLSIENLGKSLEQLIEQWDNQEVADSLISNV